LDRNAVMIVNGDYDEYLLFFKFTQQSWVSIAKGGGLDNRGMGVRFPVGAEEFSLLLFEKTGSGAHPAVGYWKLFPRGIKRLGGWSWPLAPISYGGQEYMDLYLHSPICLHCVTHKHKDKFTFLLEAVVVFLLA
jgi:hypothetical protein